MVGVEGSDGGEARSEVAGEDEQAGEPVLCEVNDREGYQCGSETAVEQQDVVLADPPGQCGEQEPGPTAAPGVLNRWVWGGGSPGA